MKKRQNGKAEDRFLTALDTALRNGYHAPRRLTLEEDPNGWTVTVQHDEERASSYRGETPAEALLSFLGVMHEDLNNASIACGEYADAIAPALSSIDAIDR